MFSWVLGAFSYLKFFASHLGDLKKAEILLFFPFYHLGGAEQVHLNITIALKKYKLAIVFTHKSASKKFLNEFKKNGTVLELNPIRNKKNRFITDFTLRSIAYFTNRNKNIKLILGSNTIYYYQFVKELKKNITTIDLIHAAPTEDDDYQFLLDSANSFNKRIVISETLKKELTQAYLMASLDKRALDNLVVIGNGINIDAGNRELYRRKKKNSMSMGFVGRWSSEKRPKLFIEIAKRVKTQLCDVEILMAGSGMNPHYQEIVNAEINFLGELSSKSELNDLYQNLSMLLITSLSEGFPLVLMESMIHGVIPICVNVGSISEHISDMENGILIQEDKEDQLVLQFVERIMYVFSRRELLDELSMNARDYAYNNFSIKNFNNSYQALVKS